MTLLPDYYDPPAPKSRPKGVTAAALRLARENPGRWVLVTEVGTKNSASARRTQLAKTLAEIPGEDWDVRRDECKVVVRFNGAPQPVLEPEAPAPEAPPT